LALAVEEWWQVKLIVGLGNPGLRYAHTRHNAGFESVDLIARAEGWGWEVRKHRSLLAAGVLGMQRVVLAKPQTYMNESGLAVAEMVRFYKLDLTQLLVVCDDLDLPRGKVRLRTSGAAGGQHGLESIIRYLSGRNFARIKIGIGRPENGRDENVDFLLSKPRGDDQIELEAAYVRAAEAAVCWVTEGPDVAMNRYNG
jgi:PTH1 family peptidyl-tRNA hydrolase